MESVNDKLKEIKDLLDSNLITRKEYEALRGEILINSSLATVNKKNFFNQLKTKAKMKSTDNNIIKFPRKYIILFSLVFINLSFHIIPSRFSIFPKDHFTFSDTFIFESDINNIIDRYNKASLMERQMILQNPLINKLFEKGILYNKN